MILNSKDQHVYQPGEHRAKQLNLYKRSNPYAHKDGKWHGEYSQIPGAVIGPDFDEKWDGEYDLTKGAVDGNDFDFEQGGRVQFTNNSNTDASFLINLNEDFYFDFEFYYPPYLTNPFHVVIGDLKDAVGLSSWHLILSNQHGTKSNVSLDFNSGSTRFQFGIGKPFDFLGAWHHLRLERKNNVVECWMDGVRYPEMYNNGLASGKQGGRWTINGSSDGRYNLPVQLRNFLFVKPPKDAP